MSARRSVLLLLLMLAGCTVLQPTDPGAGTPPPVKETTHADNGEAARILAYYAQSRQLAGAELLREQDSARRELVRSRSDANRLRYALLLTLPGTPAGEEARALEVLDPVTRSNDGALRGLAALVTASLQEQRRLETSAQALQQKLDALLTLERNMTGREGGAARKK